MVHTHTQSEGRTHEVLDTTAHVAVLGDQGAIERNTLQPTRQEEKRKVLPKESKVSQPTIFVTKRVIKNMTGKASCSVVLQTRIVEERQRNKKNKKKQKKCKRRDSLGYSGSRYCATKNRHTKFLVTGATHHNALSKVPGLRVAHLTCTIERVTQDGVPENVEHRSSVLLLVFHDIDDLSTHMEKKSTLRTSWVPNGHHTWELGG